jgi:hypothetical protein
MLCRLVKPLTAIAIRLFSAEEESTFTLYNIIVCIRREESQKWWNIDVSTENLATGKSTSAQALLFS